MGINLRSICICDNPMPLIPADEDYYHKCGHCKAWLSRKRVIKEDMVCLLWFEHESAMKNADKHWKQLLTHQGLSS